jgi:hypothetical protein
MSISSTTTRRVALLTAVAALALVPAHALGSPGEGRDLRLTGTWQVTIDPGAPGGGDAFESTLSYGGARQVMEATSGRSGATGGLGTWEQVDRTTYRMVFQKYTFDATGAFTGKAVIRETLALVDYDTYTGEATATITNAAGTVVATIPSRTVASRLVP